MTEQTLQHAFEAVCKSVSMADATAVYLTSKDGILLPAMMNDHDMSRELERQLHIAQLKIALPDVDELEEDDQDPDAFMYQDEADEDKRFHQLINKLFDEHNSPARIASSYEMHAALKRIEIALKIAETFNHNDGEKPAYQAAIRAMTVEHPYR